jgi:hypothetical protein
MLKTAQFYDSLREGKTGTDHDSLRESLETWVSRVLLRERERGAE